MHHHDIGTQAATVINMAANWAIVAGYLIVPFTALRLLPIRRHVKIAGGIFFITCAMTHISHALTVSHLNPLLVTNHIVQAIAVMWFVTGISRAISRAINEPRMPAATQDQ